MAVRHRRCRFVHAFHEVDELDVSLDILASRRHIVGGKGPGGDHFAEPLAKPCADRVGEQFQDRLERPRLDGLVSGL
jgi:hypothetical protein